MDSFTLKRTEISLFLHTLTSELDEERMNILQKAWNTFHRNKGQQEAILSDYLATEVPPMLPKIIKAQSIKGLSIGEIAALGHLIEYSTISVAAMQNWVKRDFKDYLGSPREGKKYSIDQAILLLMIDDLKATLDFESIRKLFDRLFLTACDGGSLIEPAQLYFAYAELFEKSKRMGSDKSLEELVIEACNEGIIKQLAALDKSQQEAVRNLLLIAVLSVQTSYYQSLARQYLNTALIVEP